MQEKSVLYLAHLNPMTNAHATIISNLINDYKSVYVFPVRFLKGNKEVNTKSFPFSYEIRKAMVDSVFNGSVTVFPDYTFESPYRSYLPPLLSPRSWQLRNKIVSRLEQSRFASYTGDRAERLMLLAYGLHPLRAKRLDLAATSVREKLYYSVSESGDGEWRKLVPAPVSNIIKQNWSTIESYSKTDDLTKRVLGMKFPLDGYYDSNG